ncbi:MAG: phosphate signaling complex protein PhoU [Puniceicoccaceae bacterium]
MERFFHSELETMKSHLMLMGEKAYEAVECSIQALADRDIDLAEKVIASDDEIDALEIEIDHEATRYLTLRSPVASDLRLITVAIKASHDLERVGDEAHNIAKRARNLILKSKGEYDLLQIREMAEKAKAMLRMSMDCFVNEESEKAQEVLASDAEVDRLNKDNFKGFIKLVKNEPEDTKRYMDLIFISKSLERIADHATNLAEEIIFLTTAAESRHSGL